MGSEQLHNNKKIHSIYFYSGFTVHVAHQNCKDMWSDLLTDYNPIRPLRSSGKGLVAVPRIRSSSSEGAVVYCGPALWNKLPTYLRSITTVSTFKSKLKTFLSSQAYG